MYEAVAEIPDVEYTESAHTCHREGRGDSGQTGERASPQLVASHFEAQAVDEHFEQDDPDVVAGWSADDLDQAGDRELNGDWVFDVVRGASEAAGAEQEQHVKKVALSSPQPQRQPVASHSFGQTIS